MVYRIFAQCLCYIRARTVPCSPAESFARPQDEGGNFLCPYSQQRPMSTNLACCLGLMDNSQHKSTSRLLFLVPHERSHGTMRILENPCMLLLKALKMRAIKYTMALVADSIDDTKCPSVQMPEHLRLPSPALLDWQGTSTHQKMKNGPQLCHRQWQLFVGFHADFVRPCKPQQIDAKLGITRGNTCSKMCSSQPDIS